VERQGSTLEELPPLQLAELRTLDLDAPPPDGEHEEAHVASASGVVRRGDFVYVIGDELLSLGVFRMSRPEPGSLRRALPNDPDRSGKPDLESLTVLPPFEGYPHGLLLGLGSGSEEGRDRAFMWALDADGSLRGEADVLDLGPLYERLAQDIEHLNIEGACVMGERLWLLHRGNTERGASAIAELSLQAVMDSVLGDRCIQVDELDRLAQYDLGELDGVPLAFSDATPLGGDTLVFTASAEAEGDSGPDGEIRGSVVGTIALDGAVHRLRTIDRKWKVEGVHATIDTGVVDLLFVCDQDDPSQPSPLLSASMPLDGSFERPAG
jgi:hypothetical protein